MLKQRLFLPSEVTHQAAEFIREIREAVTAGTIPVEVGATAIAAVIRELRPNENHNPTRVEGENYEGKKIGRLP